MGPAAGLRTLAAAAPAGLFHRTGRSDSLLLAGEVGCAAAAALRRDSGGAAGLSIAYVAGKGTTTFGVALPGGRGPDRYQVYVAQPADAKMRESWEVV